MNEIKNIIELFNVVNTGKSVVCNRVDICNINGKDVEELSKIWQIEKVGKSEYCYKTFDGYGKGIKHLFLMRSPENKSPYGNNPISEYYDNFRKALNNIMSYIYGDKEMLLKLVSEHILNYNGYSLNYSDQELLEDKQSNRMYKYKFTSFKTRQRVGSNKGAENAIRDVLNTHIANIYPDGIRHDEYTTMNSNSRADSVVFNKNSIHVYEIKSDKDSFTRLESQIEDYKKYADRITLVMDIKKRSAFIKNHAHKYKDIEVLFYYGPNLKLERASRGKKLNPTSDKFFLLWKSELYGQLFWFINRTSTLSRFSLSCLASHLFTKKQAHDIVNEVIYNRHKKSIGKQQMIDGDVNLLAILNKYNLEMSVLYEKVDKYFKKRKIKRR